MLEWVKVVGPLIISWPVVVLILALVMRKHIASLVNRFLAAPGGKAEIGPLKIELGKIAEEGREAVSKVNQLTEVMAESRLLELEITSEKFGGAFSAAQREQMAGQVEKLRVLVAKAGI